MDKNTCIQAEIKEFHQQMEERSANDLNALFTGFMIMALALSASAAPFFG